MKLTKRILLWLVIFVAGFFAGEWFSTWVWMAQVYHVLGERSLVELVNAEWQGFSR